MFEGLQTKLQDVFRQIKGEGKVTEEVALDYASSPHDFKLMLGAGGQRASGIEQLAG